MIANEKEANRYEETKRGLAEDNEGVDDEGCIIKVREEVGQADIDLSSISLEGAFDIRKVKNTECYNIQEMRPISELADVYKSEVLFI
jgi:hypothetical protein